MIYDLKCKNRYHIIQYDFCKKNLKGKKIFNPIQAGGYYLYTAIYRQTAGKKIFYFSTVKLIKL